MVSILKNEVDILTPVPKEEWMCYVEVMSVRLWPRISA
jgi:hypothetical protein